ncbi:MAG: TPM domain-containing protein [Nitrospiraceae bacterium]|nr:MAG: TPM domain-containing protein [Nitrospiraceae bacterium]
MTSLTRLRYKERAFCRSPRPLLQPRRLLCLILLVLVYITPVSVSAEILLPDTPENFVVDLAGIVNAGVEAELNRYLLELEQKTTAQMVVLTIPGLEGEAIEDFTLRVAHDRWKLGQKGKDNGVLLLVSLNDRKYRFEIGYGLEGILPDSLAGTIGRQALVPSFRRGDYSGGIYSAALAVITEIARNAGVTITGMPKRAFRPQRNGRGLSGPFILFFFIMILFSLLRQFLSASYRDRRSRRNNWIYWGGFGGGGFGGGGFGGFGGGGGGGFGGGGASGGW